MTYRFGPFELDVDGYRLVRRGEVVRTEPRVLEVLAYLVAHRDRIVDKEELVREVWAGDFVSDSSIARAISESRAVLGDTGEKQRWIATVYGRGYRFVAEVEEPVSGEAGAGEAHPLSVTGRSEAGASLAAVERWMPGVRWRWALVGVAALAVVAFASWLVLRRGAADAALRPFWAELNAPRGTTIAPVSDGAIAISPNGARIALVVLGDRGGHLVVRHLDTGEAEALAGTQGATYPFWSPDDRWIGFFADGKVKKVLADGGPIQSLADAPHGRGGTWSREGFIIYAADVRSPLVRIPDSGGEPSPVTELPADGGGHYFPRILPDGRHVLFDTAVRGGAVRAVAVSSVEGPGGTRRLIERGRNAQYADGFLLRVEERTLIAQPFDVGSLRLFGASTPVAHDLERGRSLANFSVSESGTLAWREARTEMRQLARFDREGQRLEVFGEPSRQYTFDFGPKGRTILVGRGRREDSRTGWDLWRMDLDRRQTTRVTFSHAMGLSGAFSPDGERIAASVWGREGSELWLQSASGAGEREHLLDTNVIHYVREWSPDGRTLLSREQRAETSLDIVQLAVDDPDSRTTFLGSSYREVGPRLTPDGEWIAYASDESGQWEIYVTDFPAQRGRWQISKGGLVVTAGGQPLLEWGPEGSAVYYGTETGLAKVAVARQGPRVELGEIENLPIDCSRLGPHRFLVEGETILALAVLEEPVEEPIRIVRDWRGLLEEVD